MKEDKHAFFANRLQDATGIPHVMKVDVPVQDLVYGTYEGKIVTVKGAVFQDSDGDWRVKILEHIDERI